MHLSVLGEWWLVYWLLDSQCRPCGHVLHHILLLMRTPADQRESQVVISQPSSFFEEGGLRQVIEACHTYRRTCRLFDLVQGSRFEAVLLKLLRNAFLLSRYPSCTTSAEKYNVTCTMHVWRAGGWIVRLYR